MAARILVCEDSSALRTLIGEALAGRGYEIANAHAGDEALELARSLQPDLVILDVVMPDRSGLEILEELRGDVRLAHARVLLMTAGTSAIDNATALSLGADRFLGKPFSPAKLASVVDELLSEPGRTAAAG